MPTTVNTTNNTVTITDEKSSVLVTNNNTGNSVGVTGVDTSTITISDIGPKGDKGDAGSVEDYSGTLSGDHITLTGNISASGDLTVKDILTSGKITAAGNVSSSAAVIAQQLYTDEYIYHSGNTITNIRFQNNRITFKAGGIQYLDLNDSSAAPHEIVFNRGSNNIDFRIEGSSDDELFCTDASTDKVGIGTNTPSYKLDVDGDIRVTGGLIVDSNINNSSIHSTNILLTNAVKYTDAGGDARYALHFDSDVVALSNRTSNGKVQIRANTSTDGSSGEITVAEFEDDSIQLNTSVTASGEFIIGSNKKLYLNKSEDTYIQSMAGDIARVVAGGNQMLILDYDTGNRAVFGNGTKVYIGANNNALPSAELQVQGMISGSGNLKIDGSQVDFTNLPTSDPGVAGRLWRNGNDVKISTG